MQQGKVNMLNNLLLPVQKDGDSGLEDDDRSFLSWTKIHCKHYVDITDSVQDEDSIHWTLNLPWNVMATPSEPARKKVKEYKKRKTLWRRSKMGDKIGRKAVFESPLIMSKRRDSQCKGTALIMHSPLREMANWTEMKVRHKEVLDENHDELFWNHFYHDFKLE